jgi:FkbM family methyltransferase
MYDPPSLFRVLRTLIRWLLRTWSRYPKAPGYLYQIVERWGERLAMQPLECRLFNGATMVCDVRDHIQRQIYFFGAYEPIEAYLFKLLMRPGMIVIDAGANVGQYTLIAAREVGRDGQVHAFEPVPATFQRLSAHVLDNELAGRVRINMTALWHRAENLRLHLASDMIGNSGAYTIGIPSETVDAVTSVGMRLDDYVAERGLRRVDFIKIDVEGAEWFALRGATAILSRWQPTMLVEINRKACHALGYDPEQVWELLRPYGYVMWAVGQSPDTCRSLSSLTGVDRVNIIFHTRPLASKVNRGWSLPSVLRFHRQ